MNTEDRTRRHEGRKKVISHSDQSQWDERKDAKTRRREFSRCDAVEKLLDLPLPGQVL